MKRILQLPIKEDLSIYSKYLWQQSITHRIFEESGQQVVELSRAEDEGRAMQAYAHWQAGELVATPIARTHPQTTWLTPLWTQLRRVPGVCLLLVLSLAIYPFSRGMLGDPYSPPMQWLTLVPLNTGLPTSFMELVRAGEYWRWFTPVFLHFSVMHLAFNGAVVWELGRRVEGRLRFVGFAILVFVLGVGSNLAQYVWQGEAYFGGLSGIAYGLLGLLLVLQRLRPQESSWAIPVGFAFGALLFLVLFSTGVLESAFGFRVANAAHWSGFALGITLAWIINKVLPAQTEMS